MEKDFFHNVTLKNETGQHGKRKNRFVLNVVMTVIEQDLF